MSKSKKLQTSNFDHLKAYAQALDSYAIVAQTDREGKIIYVNDKFCEVSGYSKEELLGKDHRVINSSHHDKEFFKFMWEQIKSGEIWRGEIKNKAKDGSFYWVDTTITPLLDSKGEIEGFISFRYEITSQKEGEAQLSNTTKDRNEKYQFLKSIQENAAHAIIAGDIDGVITSFNKKAEEMLGYKAEELIGKETPAIFHDLDEVVERSKEFSQKLGEEIEPGFETFVCHSKKGLKNEFEWTYVPKEGEPFKVLISITTIKDENGEINGFLGIAQDLTGQKNLENELISSKQKLSLLYQNSPFGFAFCDMEGNLIDVNKKYEDITGYNFEELKNLSYWDITPKKFEDQEAKQIELLNTTGRYGPYRKEYITKSGAKIPVELNGFIVDDFEGVKGIWSIVEDITDKIKAEEEYAKQKAIAQHQAKLASIGEMAAGVGHEINNPLAIIKGYLLTVTTTLDSIAEFDFSTIRNQLQQIDIAADRIAGIVKGLRTFSRSDTMSVESFNVIEALEESYNMIGEIYKKEGINISFTNSVSYESAAILTNRGSFQQVIMNLLSNAKDAVADKTFRRISMEILDQGQNVVVSVKDNGYGIPDNVREKIFDPFFTTKEVNKGTGIGLSLVHSLIQEMNSEVSFETNDEGTTFYIKIPAEFGKEKQAPKTYLTESYFSGDVLIVDDEEGVREVLAIFFEAIGMTVTKAECAEEGLDLLNQFPHKFDMIVSDMKMPGIDGPEFVRTVRNMNQITQPKLVYVIGGTSTNFEDKNNELSQMIDGYFFKPFTKESILEVVKKCLGEKIVKKAS